MTRLLFNLCQFLLRISLTLQKNVWNEYHMTYVVYHVQKYRAKTDMLYEFGENSAFDFKRYFNQTWAKMCLWACTTIKNYENSEIYRACIIV